MFDINGWELVIIVVIAAVVIGPERLPEYAAKLRGFVRELKQMAEGAKSQLREQMGPEFDDVDWKAYDPRQYDPRRIVREALLDDTPATPTIDGVTGAGASVAPAVERGSDSILAPSAVHDPARPTPYDDEAT